MDLSNVKKITIDAGEVKQIEINGVIVWKGGYTNLIPTSIDTKATSTTAWAIRMDTAYVQAEQKQK